MDKVNTALQKTEMDRDALKKENKDQSQNLIDLNKDMINN